VAMNHPDDGGDYAPLPSLPSRRRGGIGQSVRLEARPELRDRATYYDALRFAAHRQSRTAPGTWAPQAPDTWTF